MDQDRLKLIVRNLELLVDSLKAELYPDSVKNSYDSIDDIEYGYEENFEDDLDD